MKKNTLLFLAALAAIAPFTRAQTAAAPAVTAAAHLDASAPDANKVKGRYVDLHAKFLERGKSGPIGVLFLGDSITEFWAKAPKVWEENYGAMQPANFGISGDTTGGVLWRIQNGEFDGIHPKVLVFMLGTNNAATNTGEEILAADQKIIAQLRAKLPDTKFLILGIFPRGPRKERGMGDDPAAQAAAAADKMAKIAIVNHGLAMLDDGKRVRFLDLTPKFLDADGKIPMEIMPDQLHPSEKGYVIWAAAMKPILTEMMGN